MTYEESGELTTDKRTVGKTEEWSTQTDWEAYQSVNNIDIENGKLTLSEAPTDGPSENVIDNFESVLYEDDGKTLSDYYSGPINQYDRSTGASLEGEIGLEGAVADFDDILISDTNDGLPSYPSRGDTWSFLFNGNGEDNRVQMYFFAPGGSPRQNGYRVQLSQAGGMELRKWVNGSASDRLISDNDVSYGVSETVRIEVDTDSTTTSVAVYGDDGTEISSGSSSDTEFDSGAIAWGIIDETGGVSYIDEAVLGGSGN